MKKQKVIDLHLEVNQLSLENWLSNFDVGRSGFVVAACEHGTHAVTLTIWSIDSPEQITYKCQLDFTGEGDGVFIDLNYIYVFIFVEETRSNTIHFISTKTLEIERSLSTRGFMLSYFLNGILALSNEKDCIW